MAVVVSFINFKGGVGKTTLSVEVAASLYKKFNSRVLMIDLDPQSNCTLYWMTEKDWEEHIEKKGSLLNFFEAGLNEQEFDISSIIAMPSRFKNASWYGRFDEKANRGIKLIPSHMELFGVDLKLATKFGFDNPKAQLLLKKAIKSIQNDFDFIFIDCPPNLYLATQNGLFSSDYYVIVALAEYLSTLGIAHIQKSINNLFDNANKIFEFDQKAFNKPELAGVMFNRVRYLTGGTGNEEKWLKKIRSEYGDLIFDTVIPQSQKIAERPEQSEPIALSDYAADSQYSGRIHKLAEEFYDRITRP